MVLAAEDGDLEARTTAVMKAFDHDVKPILAAYCLRCHDEAKHKGDTDLSGLSSGAAAFADRSLLTHGFTKLLAHEMPPARERQPSADERRQVAAWFSSMRRLTPRDPGESAFRRLSRAEYANTLHDLLGVDPAVAADLPGDVAGAGFTSSIAPVLMEKYLLVADEALDQLIRPEQMRLSWKAGQLDAVVDGKPDPGRAEGAERRVVGPGQLAALFPAPSDGTYTITVRAASERVGKEPLRLAVRCGTRVVGELAITAPLKSPATYSLTCKLPAGRTSLALIVVNPFIEAMEPPPVKPAPPAAAPRPGPPPAASPRPPAGKAPVAKEPAKPLAPPTVRTLLIETIDLVGPPGQAPSAAQRRLFTAVPGKDLAKREAARRIATDFARRAYRRPATAAEIDVLLSVFDLADGQDEVFSEAVKLMLKGALVSPQFLFITGDSGGDDPAGVTPLGDHELAARLSYFLWSTMPDDELSALADAGTLHEPARLAQQVRRLIADPRSSAFFDSFAAPWLGLDRLDALPVDEQRFPQMTPALRRAMYDEVVQFFGAVLREDRSLLELIDADFTYLNGPLAKLYGLEGEVKGPQLRRVALTDVNRGGLLTMPGVLAVTSLPNRTSPVKRGRWVLEQILGQSAPQPPMNVAALEQQDTPANAGLNLRQRTELHRRDPACAGCHRVLDPLGFGLENFDPLGRWRERDDTGLAVDATGELPGSGAFHSPHELKRALAARRDEICRALAGRLLAHALCRSLAGYDEIVADDLAAAVALDGCKLQSLVVAVATSYPFLNRRTER